MKVINGYSIIASTHMRDDKIVVLGAKLHNYESDDYGYVVATLDTPDGTSWPSGKYFRTLPISVQHFDDVVFEHHRVLIMRLRSYGKPEGSQA